MYNYTYSKGGCLKKPVLWIGIVLKPIRIRIQLSALMPIHTRIWILPQVINKFFQLFLQQYPSALYYHSHRRQMCPNFQYFEGCIELFWKKKQIEPFICAKWKGTDTVWVGRSRMRIRIRKKMQIRPDLDPFYNTMVQKTST
jgi:hypothetical protein